MSEIVDASSQHKTLVKTEDGKLYAQTTYYDDVALEQNNKIRLSGMLEKGKLGLHDDEDIRYVISVPSSMQWQLFKTKYPETYKLITSKTESERMSGCKQLQILHPAWVVMERS